MATMRRCEHEHSSWNVSGMTNDEGVLVFISAERSHPGYHRQLTVCRTPFSPTWSGDMLAIDGSTGPVEIAVRHRDSACVQAQSSGMGATVGSP